MGVLGEKMAGNKGAILAACTQAIKRSNLGMHSARQTPLVIETTKS